jgi:hypothetical protein
MFQIARSPQRLFAAFFLSSLIGIIFYAGRWSAVAAQFTPNPHRATPMETKAQSAPAYGLYPAIVISRPDAHMRVQIEVPTLGIHGEWASPCVPVGSTAVPQQQSRVWVMFEQGNTHFPVWMGVPGSN